MGPPQQGRGIQLDLLRGFQLVCGQTEVALPVSAQRVLTFLALQTRTVSRTFAAAMLWMDCSEERACGNLRSALWRVNRPGHRLVDAGPKLIRLMPDVIVDLHEMTRVAHGVLHGDMACEQSQLQDLTAAGDLLPGWYEEWIVMERERFHQLRLHALEVLCMKLSEAGRFGQAVQAGLAAVSSEPLRESAHRALIRVYIEEGNRAEAIRQYRACQTILREELGVDPSPVTESLIRSVV